MPAILQPHGQPRYRERRSSAGLRHQCFCPRDVRVL